MSGKKPIVVRLENSYQFHEHSTITGAKAEAHRLAANLDGTFVVYAPVAVITKAPKTVEATTDFAQLTTDPDDFPF